MEISPRITAALDAATDTKLFWLGEGLLSQTADAFKQLFPNKRACMVADHNTLRAAGREVWASLKQGGVETVEPFIFEHPPHATIEAAENVRRYLVGKDAVAIAVGAGSINDICKVAAYNMTTPPFGHPSTEKNYLCVATAASVDGYASSGAPMTIDGFKKTVNCKAPLGIIADLEVLRKAPYELTSSGYADLVAKVPGGADWIIADMVEVGNEYAMQKIPWDMVQEPLNGWINHPLELKKGDLTPFADLFEGLTLSGFAMQAANSSRPASGCEHMFSHIWEMAGVKRADGSEPSHGEKVAIGSLAATAIMERVFATPFTHADTEEAARRYPLWSEREAMIKKCFGDGTLMQKTLEESNAKFAHGEDAVKARLAHIADIWQELSQRVSTQIMP
ncbi:MAG: sn-glycerol-1-phosphate dehydrogenase, partial [Kiritimatiellaeota bacterium]|nr:sn-glycerol-1-phosphate dehydrogenase [Kiritimatiellota bacterium]